jgi:1,4-alpha-glucan branching enzyme
MGAALAAAAALVLLLRPAGDDSRPIPFVLLAPHAARVTLVGDFNDWNPSATPLQSAGDSAWFVVVPLRPGRYRYSFVLDGERWMADPAAPRAVDSDFGPETSVVTILSRRT